MNEEQFKDIERLDFLIDFFAVNDVGEWELMLNLSVNPRGVRAAIDELMAEGDEDGTVSDSSHE